MNIFHHFQRDCFPLHYYGNLVICSLLTLLLVGCSAQKFLKDDEKLLNKVHLEVDDKQVNKSDVDGFIKQHANTKWFSLFKVPLGVYCWSGVDSTKKVNRFWRRMGEAPVIYDSILTEQSRLDIEKAVKNMGYLGANVDFTTKIDTYRCEVSYHVHPSERYYVHSLSTQIDDPQLDSIFKRNCSRSLLHEGMPFDVNILSAERSRITLMFHDAGYYRFNNNYVQFDADTTVGNHLVDLTLHIPLYQRIPGDTLSSHHKYFIKKIVYDIDTDVQKESSSIDTLDIQEYIFYQNKKSRLNSKFLAGKTIFQPGEAYSESAVQQSNNNLSALSATVRANIALKELDKDSLEAHINIHTNKPHSISAEVEGTNSAGDFGAAVSVGYQHNNFFRRSTTFGFKLRGAFEAITGLEGYADQNYIEYGAELNLNFPELILPFVRTSYKRKIHAQSTAAVMFSSQDRPEFHRRVFTAAWRYRWNRNGLTAQHRFDLLDLNYVFLPWISETFRKEYLSDSSSRNALLRYNYEDLFIMKWGYTFQYTNLPVNVQNGSYGKNAYSLRFSIETAGNLLYALSNIFDMQYSEEKHAYTLFGIAYAQYAKFDFDYSKSVKVDSRNSFALHAAFGIAYPFGNATILPYEKRYFSGGANSVRGWSVRSLGPGSFSGSDGNVDFIRQTGDLKLDFSIEWRTKLFWKLDGAAFIDAGNIWTLRYYEEQPGGQFDIKKFYQQIAFAYGLGFRLDLGFFILRLDGGMKAINPAFSSGKERYAIIYPNFKRDFQLHFAVGLPF